MENNNQPDAPQGENTPQKEVVIQEEASTPTDSLEQPQLVITENMRSYFYDMAGWAKFLGIMGFIFTGVMLLAALSIGAFMGALAHTSPAFGMYGALGTGVLTFILILYALLFLYPSILLYSYATKAKTGVLYGDQLSLEVGLGKLKSLFKFYGILTIIIIAIYLLAFLGGIGAGFAGA